jgi:hypothetical protein
MNIQLDQKASLINRDVILLPSNYSNNGSSTEYIVVYGKGDTFKLVPFKGHKWLFIYNLYQILISVKWYFSYIKTFFINLIDKVTYPFRKKKLNEDFKELLKTMEQAVYEHTRRIL